MLVSEQQRGAFCAPDAKNASKLKGLQVRAFLFCIMPSLQQLAPFCAVFDIIGESCIRDNCLMT